jgi:hypothetical protein
MVEGEHLVALSEVATELCADRARRCVSLLESFRDEFQELECMALAKVGHETQSGGREHLWFEVHGVGDRGLDATLLNEPFDIPELHAGHRSVQSFAQLTDWSLMTPVGAITPRSLHTARLLREVRDQVQEALAEANAG